MDKTLEIRKLVGQPASLFEQLAEEAAELAQAALKYARIMRGENVCRIGLGEAALNLQEEFTDVILSARIAGIGDWVNEEQIKFKTDRWLDSLQRIRRDD